MQVKIVNGAEEQLYLCSHIVTTTYPTVLEPTREGITVELCPPPAFGPHQLRLPEDGEVIYVTNDRGDTVQTYRWPPRRAAMHTTQAK